MYEKVKMLLLMVLVLLCVNGLVLAAPSVWWHGGVSDNMNDPNNWTDRDAATAPRTPTGNPYDIVRIGGSWGSEDLDGNGTLDPGEDLNGNGVIDDLVPPDVIGWGGPIGLYESNGELIEGGGVVLTVNPVLSETYVSSTGTAEIGWVFVLNAPNILTLTDGALLISTRDNSNLRNGGRIEVQGRAADGGPSLILAKQFRIAENGSVAEAAAETSQLRINGTGWVQMDPALRGSGAAFMIGTSDEPGTMPRGEIIIERNGRLELLPGDDPDNTPYLDFGNADPNVNQIIIQNDGELWLPGDPATIGRVGPNDVVTSLQELIDMGLITCSTGIVVEGSNPTILKAAASRMTVADLPATDTDAAIGIDPGKTYTHAIDFGTNAPAVVNGVAFDQGPTSNLGELFVDASSQGYGYVIDDSRAPEKFAIRPHGGGDPCDYADGNSADMLEDMIYYSSAKDYEGEGILITLQDLVPGTEYSVRYYYRPWDPEKPRPLTVLGDGASDGAFVDVINIDIDEPGVAHYLDYTFVADDNDVTVMFAYQDYNQGAHIYGLTCEIVPPLPLVAQWPMDEGAGTVVADTVGGNDGTMVGLDPVAAWLADGGIRFDNIDGRHVEIPHADVMDFGDVDFSISMMVRYPILPADTDRWIIKGTHGGDFSGSRYEIFHTSGTTVRFTIDNGPDNAKSKLEVPDAAFVTGEWVHVVAVRDAANDLMAIYADGVLQGTVADGSGDISNGEPLWIGESTDEEGTAMSGDIADVRIFSEALTEARIGSIY